MVIDIDETWLANNGVKVGQARLSQYASYAFNELSARVGYELGSKLAPEQLNEFNSLPKDEAARAAWLSKTYPDYPKIVLKHTKNLVKEIKSAPDKIRLLESWQ